MGAATPALGTVATTAPNRVRPAESAGHNSRPPTRTAKTVRKNGREPRAIRNPQACGGKRNHRMVGLSIGNLSARSAETVSISKKLPLPATRGHGAEAKPRRRLGSTFRESPRRPVQSSRDDREKSFAGTALAPWRRHGVGPENPAGKSLLSKFSRNARATRKRISAVLRKDLGFDAELFYLGGHLSSRILGRKDWRRRDCAIIAAFIIHSSPEDKLRVARGRFSQSWFNKGRLLRFLPIPQGKAPSRRDARVRT